MKTRGIVPVILLYALGALALTQLVPNWRLPALFAPKPPMVELAKAQADLAAAKAAADAAEAKLVAAHAAEQAKTTDQLRYSQQMASGARLAVAKAPVSAEVTLAGGLLDRAVKGLESAIGALPADRQAEIIQIVNDALSAKQAEVDAAKAQLAVRDRDLAVATAEKAAVQAQIPVLAAQVAKADAAKATAEGVVTAKTQEVVNFATKLADKEKEAGSFSALVGKLETVLIVLLALAAFAYFLLPCLAAEFPQFKLLVLLNRTVKSLTCAHP